MLPDGYTFERLRPDHAAGLATAYARSRDHLARWDPERPEEFFTEAGQRRAVAERLALEQQGLFATWVVLAPDGEVAGRTGIQNIVRGSMQGGTLGYWVDVGHLRRGLARAGVEFVGEQALEKGLHRLDAGTMVENTASQRVLESCGYERYGLAREFLYLNGAWRDHVLFQRLLHDRPPAP